VLRDASGIIFVLYRQSIPLARILFALYDADDCIGRRVTVDGWFRRGLRPYVELSRLRAEDGTTHRTWSRWVQYVLAAAAVAAGIWWRYTLTQ
jgi:hypothetical protein